MFLFFASLVLTPNVPADYPVKPVPFTAVHLHDSFWAPKIEINRTVTIPFAFQRCEENGRLLNFERAAMALKGQFFEDHRPMKFPFDDSDIYKIIEGASYTLTIHPDPKLDAYVDSLIAKIGSAQEPDGYLYTARTFDPQHPHPWSGKDRWVNEEEQSHELYDLGHLYESAVAHYQATGKRTLLDIATKSADMLDRTFGPGKRKIWPGHEVVEMGLAKLSRAAKEPRYLALAKFFLDSRGGSGEYWQANKPVVKQTEAAGHAVRASYLYSGMADVAALTGDADYVHAIDAIWSDVVDKKLYITGGIGAMGSGEAFGAPYYLPNMSAYAETCAAVGNDYWNQRLFLLHKDARYVDVFERTLYNGLISGIGLDGKSFFYPNPLESNGQHARAGWFDCPCCPGNIARFMASVPGYFYGQEGNRLYVNLYANSTSDIAMDSGSKVQVVQKTNYPWSGNVKLTVNPARNSRFSVKLRVPGWARNEAVPSDLYQFTDKVKAPVKLRVNGKDVAVNLDKGYATVERQWRKGDIVELVLPMPVRRISANDKVVDDRGKVAFQRGPIVYCAEWPDNGGKIRNLVVADSAVFNPAVRTDLLGGVTTLAGRAEALAYDASGNVARTPEKLTLIPYYTWANRGRGEMAVWLPNTEASAHPTPVPTIASQAKIKTSGGTGGSAINDLGEPRSSVDQTAFFHWWPKKGTTEWVEMTLKESAQVSECSLYWFDDTNVGECRVPESWRLMYKDGNDWKPVESTGAYGVAKDAFNRVTFKPVTTTALRLEVKLRSGWSSGIQEWKVK